MKLVYLASPYSHPDLTVRQERYLSAVKGSAFLLRQGLLLTYSPIVHCHPISLEMGLPGDFQQWSELNLAWLKKAQICVAMLIPGWDRSAGMRFELEYCLLNGKHLQGIVPLDPQHREWAFAEVPISGGAL